MSRLQLKHIAILLFSILPLVSSAQEEEINFETNLSKTKLGINERLKVEFKVNKNGDNFTAPNFNGFEVIMGPSLSQSSVWINGKRTYSLAYSYILKPISKGEKTIGQATIEIDGNTYKSVTKKVTITDAVDNPNAPKTADDIADENLHLVAEVSKGSPYLNEAVTVVYKLYVSPDIRVNNFRALDNPKYNNFWSQDIPVKRYDAQNATYQGKQYRSVILKRVVLYPQKSGNLTIEPLGIELFVDVPTNRRDFFGGRIYRPANKTVSAGSRTLRVKPLPETGKPADFSGAVGDFDFNVTTSKTNLNASESLQATVEVSGKGNLKLFQLPEPDLPSALEVYEPEFEEKVRTTVSGMDGKVTNNYTIVPSYRGKYPIPSISFSYFNPKTEQYETLNSNEITINVMEGPEDTSISLNPAGNPTKIIIPTGKQFHFIKTNTNFASIKMEPFYGSNKFYTLFFGPLLLIPIVILARRRKEKNELNVEGTKLKKVNRLARKYLSTAKKALGDEVKFYVALEKGLHNYLKAKLKIETSEFSKEKITEILRERAADEETVEGFIGLLKNCEMARYSPFSEVQMNSDFEQASQVISRLDKQL
ncbi:BatD family protein [Croceivirga thetidis]|uniref:Protein BatD n=1 Tax=Croceivirga thetidis TaxID=2721623 RepID=A0ABX1GNB0_9FLAO|nr:BatD family protein [Croceivirga thetidis]NKI31393.1 protein BatD [Croceivirga thetidis]